jgi:uncharacterized membrane-anchored protein
MKRVILPIVFVLMCAVQLFVPAKAIYDQEKILGEGKEFKFETQPIDPKDPFRGAYITLHFTEDHIDIPDSEKDKWASGDVIFVYLDNSNGFAKVKGVSDSRPVGGDFIEAKVKFVSDYDEPRILMQYPFERFYLEESKAPKAEKYYNESRADSARRAYAVVRIMDGKASLIDVRIDEKSLVDIVRESNEKLKQQ